MLDEANSFRDRKVVRVRHNRRESWTTHRRVWVGNRQTFLMDYEVLKIIDTVHRTWWRPTEESKSWTGQNCLIDRNVKELWQRYDWVTFPSSTTGDNESVVKSFWPTSSTAVTLPRVCPAKTKLSYKPQRQETTTWTISLDCVIFLNLYDHKIGKREINRR